MMNKAKSIIVSVCILSLLVYAKGSWAQGCRKCQARHKAANALTLTLAQASRLALINNFEIQLAKYDTWIARTQDEQAQSIYDTIIEAEVSYRKNKAAQTSTLAGSKTLDNNYNIGLEKKFPTGTTVGVDFTNNRNWSDSSFATLNPSHDSALGITLEQSLGKNFFGLQDRGNIKITQKDMAHAQFISFEKIEAALAAVQTAYWDLVLQRELLKIEQRMVTHAKELLNINIEKIQDGLVEPPDVIAAESNYKKRINQKLLAQNQLQLKENVLRLMLNIEDRDMDIVPQEAMDMKLLTPVLEQTLQKAFDNRQDYKKALNKIESNDIALSIKKNNLWPEINLEASLTRNGIDDHFNQAISKISEEDNPNIYTGIDFSMPLENRKARSQLKAAELQKARSLVALKFLERQITIEIIDQVKSCAVLKQVAANAVNVAELETDKLAAEEKRFKYGRSNTDTLIRFQDDMTQALGDAAQAKFNYYAARIELERRQGSLLKKYWQGAL